VLINARRCVARQGADASGRLAAAVAELEIILGRTGQVVGQTRSRLGGVMPPSASRLVSLHDPDARPIAKGRLGKPVEFGYKAQVVDNVDSVLDHSVHQGNPPDAPMLAPAIGRIQALLGRAVRAVTADRGYGEAKVDDGLHELGVTKVVIPRKGKPSPARREVEHRSGFRRLVKWRTGCEGRISYLKRRYGLDRTLFDTVAGAQTWCGLGVRPQHRQDRHAGPDQRAATHTQYPARPTSPAVGSRRHHGRAAAARSVVRPHRRLTLAPVDPARPDGASRPGGTPSGAETGPAERHRGATASPCPPSCPLPSPPFPAVQAFFGASRAQLTLRSGLVDHSRASKLLNSGGDAKRSPATDLGGDYIAAARMVARLSASSEGP